MKTNDNKVKEQNSQSRANAETTLGNNGVSKPAKPVLESVENKEPTSRQQAMANMRSTSVIMKKESPETKIAMQMKTDAPIQKQATINNRTADINALTAAMLNIPNNGQWADQDAIDAHDNAPGIDVGDHHGFRQVRNNDLRNDLQGRINKWQGYNARDQKALNKLPNNKKNAAAIAQLKGLNQDFQEGEL